MTPRQCLAQARRKAQAKGHTMTRFERNASVRLAHCTVCGAHLLCQPDALAMSGLALRVQCDPRPFTPRKTSPPPQPSPRLAPPTLSPPPAGGRSEGEGGGEEFKGGGN